MKEPKVWSDYAILCLLTARILFTSRLTEINPCIGSNIVAERSKLGGKTPWSWIWQRILTYDTRSIIEGKKKRLGFIGIKNFCAWENSIYRIKDDPSEKKEL